ncbi:MAG: putative OB-fold protein [Kiritimatiellia bacterium]|jgi:uncharacterized OB-fold protein|tara:strand:+ start:3441 stop:3842 length:402 start_codon:yes stop_codon:yes gene_type:complete
MADRIGVSPLADFDPLLSAIRERAEAGDLCCLQCSDGCGVTDYAARICPECAGPIELSVTSGRGRIHSLAVYHINYTPKLKAPYVVLFVELDEGCRLAALLDKSEQGIPAVGDPVKFISAKDGAVHFARLQKT